MGEPRSVRLVTRIVLPSLRGPRFATRYNKLFHEAIIVSAYQEIVEREQKYLLNTYARYPIAIARGKGVYVYDVEGKRYLDFLSGLGVNALGHAHPRIVKVIREQAAKVIHVSNLYYNEYQGLLAEKLCTKSGLDRAFFSNSGTEAIEGALKLVRGRPRSSRWKTHFTAAPWVRWR